MAVFNHKDYQLRQKSITKEEWNRHLFSSKHLHREAHGF